MAKRRTKAKAAETEAEATGEATGAATTDRDEATEAAGAEAEATPFETLLERTEGIVEALESGELDLDQSLKRYEEGIANLRACAKQLDTAERKVRLLIEKSAGVFQLEDFEDPADPDLEDSDFDFDADADDEDAGD